MRKIKKEQWSEENHENVEKTAEGKRTAFLTFSGHSRFFLILDHFQWNNHVFHEKNSFLIFSFNSIIELIIPFLNSLTKRKVSRNMEKSKVGVILQAGSSLSSKCKQINDVLLENVVKNESDDIVVYLIGEYFAIIDFLLEFYVSLLL